ncbi:short chain dehydrogenase [Pseudovirgaria hyperparasitica]|uniref:Short chain dehydrogenase n=1 Tax=Pseudovirgaria hyperparasitica TaxID=470096 RepID=A0A6A6VTU0_9PEZI|nr:short chain dehydrogenase [Pseudovirgaria hyperparasitica]KAF2753020.1 short chain dehydrogenase [Pseudovirgaria hyperparasitica]
MSLPLAGKVALITGGSKGIGAQAALRLARDGAKVVVNYSSDSKAADDIVNQIGGGNALAVKANAANVTEIEGLVKQTVAKFGKIDILIPNAGILPMKTLEQTTEQDFDNTFGLNVKGPYFLVQKAVPFMNPGGRIILVSTTLTGLSPITPNYLLYVSTKGSIEQMARVMAKDLASKGINVNAVAPGPTGTDLFLKGKPDAIIEKLAAASPYNRLGKPDEIADTMAFLSGNDSRWITGQTLRINGGAV